MYLLVYNSVLFPSACSATAHEFVESLVQRTQSHEVSTLRLVLGKVLRMLNGARDAIFVGISQK